jgi:tripartite-type tricarboxylate transporter receptor subunit TctC
MNVLTCRKLANFLWAALFVACASPALSQSFPGKPIRIVVQFPAGNGADITARILAQHLSLTIGQPVIVENRPGAKGVSGVQAVANADPDGYTLLHMANVNAISQSLFKTIPYDIVATFAPISTVSFTPMLFLTPKSSRANSFKDLVSEANAKSAQFTVGVGTLGSTQHLTAELFRATTRQNIAVVPFNSNSNLMSALARGEVDVVVDLITAVLSPLKAGAFKALAISGEKRFAGLPELPTLIESGFVDYPINSWGMIAAPARTPAAIVDRLSRESVAALAKPEVQAKAQEQGITLAGSTPGQAREQLAAEITRWRNLINSAGIERM